MEILIWSRGSDGSIFTRLPLIQKHRQDGERDFTKLDRLSELARDTPLSERGVEEVVEARNQLAEQVDGHKAKHNHFQNYRFTDTKCFIQLVLVFLVT